MKKAKIILDYKQFIFWMFKIFYEHKDIEFSNVKNNKLSL